MPRRSRHAGEYAELGRRIRELRRRRGWTQVELAEYAGISSSYLAEVERGGRNPSLETILGLAAALDASSGYLVDGMRYDPPPGMDRLANLWVRLGEKQRQALVQVASALASREPEPPQRSASAGKSRAKTSK